MRDHNRVGAAALSAISAAMFCAAPTASAGAWNYNQGQGQSIISVSGQSASDSFDARGQPVIPTDYQKVTADIYWEHGITDTLTGVVNAGVETVTLDSPGRDVQNTAGLSAAHLALRRQVYKTDSAVFALQAGVIFGQDGENIPGATLGLGGTDFEIGALAGRSAKLFGKDIFAQIHGARRFRGEGFADETRIDIAAGIETGARLQVFLQGFYARGEKSERGFPAYERFKVQPSVAFKNTYNRRVQIGISQTITGKNSLKDTGAFIALWHSY